MSKDLICYCFEYTAEDIQRDYLKNNRSTIMERIQAEKKLGNCQCAVMNPKGRGCLVDVRRVVDRISETADSEGPESQKQIIENPGFPTLQTLDNSLKPLKDRFNSNRDKIRFLTLLSPMGPRGGQQGARAVHESIITKFPQADISISTVWIQMLPGDTEIAAREKSIVFNDPRVQQFWDPDQLSGKAIAEALGYKGRVAWDIYLFYKPGNQWQKQPPQPTAWMHQISEDWVDRSHFYTGKDLGRKLFETAQELLANIQ